MDQGPMLAPGKVGSRFRPIRGLMGGPKSAQIGVLWVVLPRLGSARLWLSFTWLPIILAQLAESGCSLWGHCGSAWLRSGLASGSWENIDIFGNQAK